MKIKKPSLNSEQNSEFTCLNGFRADIDFQNLQENNK